MSQSFHAEDKDVRGYYVSLTDALKIFEPVKLFVVPDDFHSQRFHAMHGVVHPNARESNCWTWAGSPTWARFNPTQKPKEVKAVVLETTALNCHVH